MMGRSHDMEAGEALPAIKPLTGSSLPLPTGASIHHIHTAIIP